MVICREISHKLLEELFEIEVDEVMASEGDPVSDRGKMAADIVTLISYSPPEEDLMDDEDE